MTAATPRRHRLGRRFTQVWSATAAANFGDGILVVGLPLVAVQLSRSPLLVSLVSTFATLPWLVVALFAGALADRRDRRRIILGAAWARVVVLAACAGLALLGQVDLIVLYVAVLVLGTAEVFADSTTQSILPMVVERDRLAVANGRVIAAQRVANDFLGGPVAGIAVAAGTATVFGVPALLYLLAGFLMLTLSGRFGVERTDRTGIWSDIVEGVRFLGGHRVLRTLAVLAGLMNFATSAYLAVFVLWAVGEESAMQLPPPVYGALIAGLAAGGVAGALGVEWLSHKLGELPVLLWGAGVSSALLLPPVLFPTLTVAFPSFAVVGFAATLTNVALVSMRQRLIPEQLLGRVNATYRLIGMGTLPFGAAAGGAVGSLFNLPVVFVSAVIVGLLATGFVALTVTGAAIRRAEVGAAD